MKLHIEYFTIFFPLLFIACSSRHHGDESQLKDTVDSFATAYFNWHYKESLPFCTRESEPWLRYAASNVHQEDVDILRTKEEGASHEITEITYSNNGSTAHARIIVKNFLQMDTIGTAGHIVRAAQIEIPLILHNGKWLVRMEGPLRNEK